MGKFGVPRTRTFPRELNLRFEDSDYIALTASTAGVDYKLALSQNWNSMEDSDTLNGNDASHIVGWKDAAAPYEKYHIGAMDVKVKVRRDVKLTGNEDKFTITNNLSTTATSTGTRQQSAPGFYFFIYFNRSVGTTDALPWMVDTPLQVDKDKVILEMKQSPRTVWGYMPPYFDVDGIRPKDITRTIKSHMTLNKQLTDRRVETIFATVGFEGGITAETDDASAPAALVSYQVGVVSERTGDNTPALEFFITDHRYCSLFKPSVGGVAGE